LRVAGSHWEKHRSIQEVLDRNERIAKIASIARIAKIETHHGGAEIQKTQENHLPQIDADQRRSNGENLRQ
jgi:hypothetical protein